MPIDPNTGLEVIRINELNAYNVFGQLALTDRIALWLSSANKTVYADLASLRELIDTAGTGATTPSTTQSGSRIIYIVPDTIAAGTTQYTNSTIAGKDFYLSLEGRPLIKQTSPARSDAEYEVLSGGGFKLLGGLTLMGGQRYQLDLYTLVSGPTDSSTTAGALFSGSYTITASLALDATHVSKLLRIKTQQNATVTLWGLADVPDGTVVVLSTAEQGASPVKIAVKNPNDGDSIYMNGYLYTSVWMHAGESLWLYKSTNGYVIISDFGRIYNELAQPIASYLRNQRGHLMCEGQIVLRADYPRLWEHVQTLGASLVDEAQWQMASKDYIGCFSRGDGQTNFRLPNLSGLFLRGYNASEANTLRVHNAAGGWQRDMLRDFRKKDAANRLYDRILKVDGTSTVGSVDSNTAGNEPNLVTTVPLDANIFGPETVPPNAAMHWLIKY